VPVSGYFSIEIPPPVLNRPSQFQPAARHPRSKHRFLNFLPPRFPAMVHHLLNHLPFCRLMNSHSYKRLLLKNCPYRVWKLPCSLPIHLWLLASNRALGFHCLLCLKLNPLPHPHRASLPRLSNSQPLIGVKRHSGTWLFSSRSNLLWCQGSQRNARKSRGRKGCPRHSNAWRDSTKL
jgi:hypothetical protein